MSRFPAGQRLVKKGLGFRGVSEGTTGGGWVKVAWDDGPLAKFRPRLVHPSEIEPEKPS